MKKAILLMLLVVAFTSFQQPKTLKGTWQFCGGYFNGKPNPAPKDYTLQRKYTTTNYEAFLLEKGEKPYKYEAGDYKLVGDTCLETPDGVQIGRGPGNHLLVRGGPPMLLMAIGTEPRRGFALILHGAGQPPTTLIHDWHPQGLCEKLRTPR